MTELLYMKDCYLKEAQAKVTDIGTTNNEPYVVLDKTIFYPEGGGQPSDTGTLSFGGKTVEVKKVRKEQGIVKHYTSEPVEKDITAIERINWGKRHAYMRMHTAQHILSAIILDEYGSETAGNQIHHDRSRVDFAPIEWSEEIRETAVKKFNEITNSAVPVEFEFTTREDMLARVNEARRKLFERLPAAIKEIRLVNIKNIDLCPCAGTHVKNTSEIGRIRILGTENKGKMTVRVNFTLE